MKIQLKRSGILEGGNAKAPTAEQLEYGELAINYNAGDPSLFLKNSDNSVVKISGAGSAGSFDGDYNSLINTPTIGNGNININAGDGLTHSGSNAKANQTGDTTRTLKAKAGDSTIVVDGDGIKVQNANITPDWNNVQNKPPTSTGASLKAGDYLIGSDYNGSASRTWSVDATTTNTENKVVARDTDGDINVRHCKGRYMWMDHIQATRTSDTVFYSSVDDYIRKNTASGMRTALNVPTTTGENASGTWGISITGTAGTAGSADSATNATNTTNARIDHDTGNAWHRIVMVDDGKNSGSNVRLKTDNANTIAINPSSSTIRATTFKGALEGAANSAANADTVDNLHAASFLRSDANDTATGTLTFNGNLLVRDAHLDFGDGTSATNTLRMGASNDWTIHRNSDNWTYINDIGNGIIFQDSGTKVMRLRSGGVFHPDVNGGGAIGTSTHRWGGGQFDTMHVSRTLNVRGAIDLADDDILRFGTGDDAEFFCNGSHFYLDLNSGIGNFYIRDGSTTRFTFDDDGHFTATGDIRSNSDIRIKENLTAISDPVSKLNQLNGYHYYRTDLEQNQYGVVAQEVEKVFPEMVSEDEESGIKSVAYQQLVPVLLEAVKTLSAEVAELKKQIS